MQPSQHSKASRTRRSANRITTSRALCSSRSSGRTEKLTKGSEQEGPPAPGHRRQLGERVLICAVRVVEPCMSFEHHRSRNHCAQNGRMVE